MSVLKGIGIGCGIFISAAIALLILIVAVGSCVAGSSVEPDPPPITPFPFNSSEARTPLPSKASATRTSKAPTATPELIRMTIGALQEEYDANQLAADGKYDGQWMYISGGEIRNITPSRVYIDNPGDTTLFKTWSLDCDFDDSESSILAIRNEQITTVFGLNDGMSFGSVQFKHCVFEVTSTPPLTNVEAPRTPTLVPPPPAPTFEPIIHSGGGQQASNKFVLSSGITIFRMNHNGNSNFSIWLLNDQGNNVELLVNDIGPFDGSKAVGIKTGGTHILDISADGAWTVEITQPSPSASKTLPLTFSGQGQEASRFFRLESGLTTFRMNHSGNSNFAIWLLDDQGNNVELLVNDIGPFDGSKAVGIDESGTYILDISADGAWIVKVE